MKSFFQTAPFIRIVLPLIAGILTGYFFSPAPFVTVILLILVFAGLIILLQFKSVNHNYSLRWIFGIPINLLFFLTGLLLLLSHSPQILPEHINYSTEKVTLIGTIDEPVVSKNKTYKAVIKLEALIDNDTMIAARGNLLTYIEKSDFSASLLYGDKLLFNSYVNEVESSRNPSQFDYKKFLKNKGILYQVYIKEKDLVKLSGGKGNVFLEEIYSMRSKLLNIINKYVKGSDEKAVASALILGNRDTLDQNLKNAYSSAGAIHVLAVSGLHVGIIYLILNYLLFFLKGTPFNKWMKPVFLLTGIWCFAVITGLSPSVLRAATMFSFIIAGQSLRRYTNIYNSIAASAFLLLFFDPFLLFNPGFQLSYLAVTGIVFFHPKIYNLIYLRYWLPDKIWSLTCVTLAAQIATFPLTIYYFNQFPLLFFLSNLIVVPAASVILYLGTLLVLLSPFEVIAEGIGIILSNVIYGVNMTVFMVEGMPNSVIKNIYFNEFMLLLSFLFIINCILFLNYRKAVLLQFIIFIFLITGIFYTYRDYLIHHQQKLVVYHANYSSVIEIIEGDKAWLIYDNNKILQQSSYIYQEAHTEWGIDQVEYIDQETSDNGIYGDNFILKYPLLKFKDKNIFFLKDQNISGLEGDIDYLMISGRSSFNKDLISVTKPSIKEIIVDSSVSFIEMKKIKRIADRFNIPVHFAGDEAVVINL